MTTNNAADWRSIFKGNYLRNKVIILNFDILFKWDI